MYVHMYEVLLNYCLVRVHDTVHFGLVILLVLSLLIVLPQLVLKLMLGDVGHKLVKQTANLLGFVFVVLQVNQELDHPALHDHAPQARQVSADFHILNFLKDRIPHVNVLAECVAWGLEHQTLHLAMHLFRVAVGLFF